jgi:hypothetical protein
MDHLFYWLDLSGWLTALQRAWIWASVSSALAVFTIVGIAAVARRYDRAGNDTAQFSSEA